jgi:hypothetical protein
MSISSCIDELGGLQDSVMGTLLVGDLNVHHKSWLKYSSSSSAEGEALRAAASDMGLKQKVKKPTREKYLLDLVLTDIAGVTANVLPKIADHNVVEVIAPLLVPASTSVQREVWLFRSADWDRLDSLLKEVDWTCLNDSTSEGAATMMTRVVLDLAAICIKKKVITEVKSTHPWLNDRVTSGRCKEAGARNDFRKR